MLVVGVYQPQSAEQRPIVSLLAGFFFTLFSLASLRRFLQSGPLTQEGLVRVTQPLVLKFLEAAANIAIASQTTAGTSSFCRRRQQQGQVHKCPPPLSKSVCDCAALRARARAGWLSSGVT